MTGLGSTPKRGAVALLCVSLAAFAGLCLALHPPMADVLVYRAEGRAVVQGTDLYGFTVTHWQLPATYPPFAALLFVPVTWPPLPVLKAAFVLGNIALLALLLHLSLRLVPLPRRHHLPVLIAGTAAGLWLEPVYQTVLFGQVNLALACLVLWDVRRPDGARGKGLAVGVAAGIKLTPAIFVVHLFLTGRARAGWAAIAGFAGTVAVGACVLPGATVEFFTRRLFETTRVGKAWIVDNQSLQGLVARLAHTTEPGLLWLVPAALVAVAGLALAAYVHHRRGWEAWSLLVTALTALLVSPISWSHHWVWCVPLIVLACRRRAWWALALGAVFTARSLWLVPKEGSLDLRLAWWWQAPASPYPLLALAVLAGVGWAAYSGSASTPVSASTSASAESSRSWESTMR